MPETLIHEPPKELSHNTPPELERVLRIRRNDLQPEVRAYADNFRDQVRKIFADHGVKSVDEFSAAARAKTITKETVQDVRDLLRILRTIVDTGVIPPDYCSLDRAREIMGTDSFFGPEALATTFGITLETNDIPPILFTAHELQEANARGEFLILRTDKDKNGKPLTAQAMHETAQPLLDQQHKGKALFKVDWYKDDPIYTTETPRTGWALVSREPIPDSTSKNYLEQTQRIIDHLTTVVFKSQALPQDYQAAIDEFEREQTIIKPLISSDWKKAAETLASIQITTLTRHNFPEVLSDMLTILTNTDNNRLLTSFYTWTSSRSSGGGLVSVGRADAAGAFVDGWRPDNRVESLVVLLSRRG